MGASPSAGAPQQAITMGGDHGGITISGGATGGHHYGRWPWGHHHQREVLAIGLDRRLLCPER
ncbi:MAG: hypothetical protein LIP09_10410 [Bacteroidales bacterium]|nr:hypothetical protein [Bacteroidales bacterium]